MGQAVDLVPNLVLGRKSNGRSRYDAVAKRELVLRCLQPGVSLAATALAHGLNANLLRKWVVKYTRDHGMPRPPRRNKDLPAVLLPVQAVAETTLERSSGRVAGQLEVRIGSAMIRIIGAVDVRQLRTVIDCLTSRA